MLTEAYLPDGFSIACLVNNIACITMYYVILLHRAD